MAMKKNIRIFLVSVVIGFVGGCFWRLYWKSTQKPKLLIEEPLDADDMVHIAIKK